MSFTGYLSKFSLPELFQFLEEGYKTGLLTIRVLDKANIETSKKHYIWLQQGRIVAAADSLDNRGLITLITQRSLVSEKVAIKTLENSPINMAFGLSLKSQGLLQAEQLALLFRAQLTTQVSPLFQLHDGKYDFTVQTTLPNAEMTGLSMPATEATLTGLRMLKEWGTLEKKLPEPTSGLVKKILGRPQVRLDYSECQVWEYANGELSLQDIAQTIETPIDKVQQIAFRLIITNLVEESLIIKHSSNNLNNLKEIKQELPVFADLNSTNAFGEKSIKPVALPTKTESYLEKETSFNYGTNKTLESVTNSSPKTAVSQSFLQNLVGFLQSKTAGS